MIVIAGAAVTYVFCLWQSYRKWVRGEFFLSVLLLFYGTAVEVFIGLHLIMELLQ